MQNMTLHYIFFIYGCDVTWLLSPISTLKSFHALNRKCLPSKNKAQIPRRFLYKTLFDLLAVTKQR